MSLPISITLEIVCKLTSLSSPGLCVVLLFFLKRNFQGLRYFILKFLIDILGNFIDFSKKNQNLLLKLMLLSPSMGFSGIRFFFKI